MKKVIDRSRLTKEIYTNNEYDANESLAKGAIFTGFILIIAWILYLTDVFNAAVHTFTLVNIVFPILMVVLFSNFIYLKLGMLRRPKIKYFIIMQFIFAIAVLNVMLPKHGILMWAPCLIMVNHYYDSKTLLVTYIVTSILMLIAIYGGMFFGEWDANLLNGTRDINIDGVIVNVDEATIKQRIDWVNYLQKFGDNRYVKVFVYYYLPRFLIVTIIYVICRSISQRSLKLLVLESDSTREKEKMSSELNVASSIQLSVLPNRLDDENKDNIYGIMDPAKTVGGDFYDYFYVDEHHLAIVVADVSGKSIPASLFMMKTEALIKSLTTTFKGDTSTIMERSNIALCSQNDACMFVTCWLGILNLLTGELKYTNAGHNAPIVIKNGRVMFLDDKPGVVLGALDDTKYTEQTIILENDDKIILYTDGVVEAHNENNELYGVDRLFLFAENNKDKKPEGFAKSLRADVDLFINGSEQFDDITILACEYKKRNANIGSRVFKADVSELDNLFDYSSAILRLLEFSKRDIIMINTALEEVFVNVAKYAYEDTGMVEIIMSKDEEKVSFIFKDGGKPFNPLDREDPNITAKSDEREVGGLGIYMVKRIMDEVSYEYKDNSNVLTLVKYRRKA